MVATEAPPALDATPLPGGPRQRPARTGTTGVPRLPRDRIVAVDAARALAIFGMFAVHVGPTGRTDVLGRIFALPHGRASLLFALVAGVGVSLLASRAGSVSSVRRTLAWRAAVLLPIGLGLQLLGHGVNVILHSYALLFLAAALLVALPDRWLLRCSAGLAVLAPALYLALQLRAPEVFDRSPVAFGDAFGDQLHGLALSGPYPLITWLVPVAFGMWLGRQDLHAPRLQRGLVLVGTAVAVASVATAEVGKRLLRPGDAPELAHYVLATPHSQMPLWLVTGTAAACAVLGAALWAVPRVPRLLHPLVAAGQLAFTVYVAHLLVLAAVGDQLRTRDLGEASSTLAIGVGLVLTSTTLWRRWLGRGPLERLLRPPPGRPRSLGLPRPRPSRSGVVQRGSGGRVPAWREGRIDHPVATIERLDT